MISTVSFALGRPRNTPRSNTLDAESRITYRWGRVDVCVRACKNQSQTSPNHTFFSLKIFSSGSGREKVIFTLECSVKFPKALETKPQTVFLPKQKVCDIYRLPPTHFELPKLQSNLPDHRLATARAGRAAAGRRQSSSCQGPRRRTLTGAGARVKHCFPVLAHLQKNCTAFT